MSTATPNLEQVVAVTRQPRSPLLLGQESVLAPKAELVVNIEGDDPIRARIDHGRMRLAEGQSEDLARQIADTAVRRANDFPRSSLAWSQAGFALLASGELEAAKGSFERALDIEPALRRAQIGLARTHFESGDADKAIAALTALHAERPTDEEVAVSLAVVLAKVGRSDDALHVIESLPDRPEAATFLAVRGALRIAAARYTDAVSDLRKATRLKPDWVHVRNSLGLAELKAGRLKSAERRFREASRIAPLFEEPFLNLLRVMMLERRFSDVLREAQGRYEPALAPATVSRIAGSAAFEMSEWRAALAWWSCAIERTDDTWMRSRIQNDVGCVYSRLGQHAKAGEYFELSVKTHTSELAVLNRARAFLYEGKGLLGVAWLNSASELADTDAHERQKLLAQSLFQARMFADSLRVALELVKHPSADADVFALVTSLLTDFSGEPKLAARFAREGLQRFPGTTILLNNLAYALLQEGNAPEASRALSLASATNDRERAVLYATKGLLELKLGNTAAGIALYERALGSATDDALRERIRSKRDLETARALIAKPDRSDEAVMLLRRAVACGEAAAPYPDHASRELLRLTKAQAE
jgi:tetratricopeptide (TPR) repeat protein